MDNVFREFLFGKHILVNQEEHACSPEDGFCALIALSGRFGIRVTEGFKLAQPEMVADAAMMLGEYVPEPFYRGFPDTVKKLTPEEKLFDQLYAYTVTYGLGWFEEVSHSVIEDTFTRLKFRENVEPKEFRILTESQASEVLLDAVYDMLKSTRPLNVDQMTVVSAFVKEFGADVLPDDIPCKDTAIALLLETRNPAAFAGYLTMPDVIRMVEMQIERYYCGMTLKKLNLRNQDRKLITGTMDRIGEHWLLFLDEAYQQIRECYEKQKIWCGLLHHIHYRAKNGIVKIFVDGMRNRKNRSAYHYFEKELGANGRESPVEAAEILLKAKGSGALIRNLNYILSRCRNRMQAFQVMALLGQTKPNPVILVQMLGMFHNYREDGARTFHFTKMNRMRVHTETEEEQAKRKSRLDEGIRKEAEAGIRNLLMERLHGKLGNQAVYISEGMKRIAVPIQMSTGNLGFDTLTTGSRIPIPEWKKIRAFTYWEKVNDIDLSCFAIDADGKQTEFSWRTMWRKGSETGIIYSGDQTSGFNGGSEYFDISVGKVKKAFPGTKYLVFCDNIYSSGGSVHFKDITARAGFMLREEEDSGEVFEPKTVKTSWRITADSSFGYLFGIDLETMEMVWLNMNREGNHAVAGQSKMGWLVDILESANVFNAYELYTLAAGKVVDNPEEADLIVTDTYDREVLKKIGKEVVTPMDFEKMFALLR